MKLMRSRIRLLTLLTACAFLLAAVFCAASALRSAGVSLQFPMAHPVVTPAASPDVSPEASESVPPAPSLSPDASGLPEMTTTPDQEYNLFGL